MTAEAPAFEVWSDTRSKVLACPTYAQPHPAAPVGIKARAKAASAGARERMTAHYAAFYPLRRRLCQVFQHATAPALPLLS